VKVLVINAGSSSLKYQLFNMENQDVLAKGRVERIGMDSAILVHEPKDKEEIKEVSEILEHTTAIRKVLDKLVDKQHGVLASIDEIDAVGHRVVHGGEAFSGSVIVDDSVKKEITRLIDLAPLHNPAALLGLSAVQTNMPNVPNVFTFDTAFHQTMPKSAYMYAIPTIFYTKHKVRRYGAHGTSHLYVGERTAEFLGRPIEELKIISCHIGNGASVTAINGGKSVDTSMGMTPLEGLMMGTRSGDIDPAVVTYAMGKEDLTISEANSMLNKHSGLLAISKISSDMREVEEAMNAGDPHATLAFDMYIYRLRKYIGAYAAAMDGVDAIVFTAGVGENSVTVREAVCTKLNFLGVEFDSERNKTGRGFDKRISKDTSKVEVLVIPTNEEWMIARDTFELVSKK